MRTKYFLGVIFLLLAIVIILALLNPFPRGKVVFATDYSGSAWNMDGRKTISFLKKHGIELSVVETEGANQNIQLLNNEKSEVNAALLFGSMLSKNQTENIYSLAYVGYSPIWIFYKNKAEAPPKSLADLAKKNVAVGPKESGSYATAKTLFEFQGIDIQQSTNFHSEPFPEGLKNYLSGKADVIIFVGDRYDPVVKKLFYDVDTKIFELNKKDLEYLPQEFFAVKLPAKSIDVDRFVPEKDVNMISTTTILAVKRNMQPAMQVGLLLAASEIVKDSFYLIPTTSIAFPAPAYSAPMEVSDSAKSYFENSGRPPFLTKFFPTWLVYF